MKFRLVFRFIIFLIFCLHVSVVLSQNIRDSLDIPKPSLNSGSRDSVSPRKADPLYMISHMANDAYKSIISEQLSSGCGFTPSCSPFSAGAMKRFPFIKGIALTGDRLMRCNGETEENMPLYFSNPVDASIIDLPEYYDFAAMKMLKRSYVDSLILTGDTLTINELGNYNKKSAIFAGFLSAIIPGSGKYYLGYPAQAKSSLLTNLALGASAAEILIKSESGLLATAGIGLFSVFYVGNIWGSASLAKKIEYDQFLSVKSEKPGSTKTNKSINSYISDTLMYIEKAKSLFDKGEYNKLYIYFQEIPEDVRKNNKEILILRWKTMVELGMLYECRTELSEYNSSRPEFQKTITGLPIEINSKSPLKAERLSSWCPGLGQVYAGYPLKGAVSLLLNAGCAIIGWKAFANDLYINGVLFGIYPLLRFWTGGKTYSYSLAQKTNQKRTRELKEQYLKVISNIFISE